VEFEVLREGTASVDAYGVEYSDLELGSPTKQDSPFRKEIPGKPITLPKIRIENDMAAGFRYQVRPYLRIGNQYTFGEYMTFESKGVPAAKILEVSERRIFLAHEVILKGKHFSSNPRNNLLAFVDHQNAIQINVYRVNGDEITVRIFRNDLWSAIPNNTELDLVVSVNGKETVTPKVFEFEIPRIVSISKTKAKVGEKITFESSFSGKVIGNIYLNNKEVFPIQKEGNRYTFDVPNVGDGSYVLKLGLPQENSVYSEPFSVIEDWTFHKDLTTNGDFMFYFEYIHNRNTILGFLNVTIPFFAYESPNFVPEKITSWPIDGLLRESSLYHLSDIDDNFYFGLGGRNLSIPNESTSFNDFYRMDMNSGSWEKLPDLPLGPTAVKMVFDWQGKICVVFNERDNFFFFDPVAESWEESGLRVPDLLKFSNAFDIEGNNIYFLLTESREGYLYSYSLFSNPTKLNSLPLEVLGNSKWDIQKIEGKILVAESSRQMLEYDLQTNQIRRMQTIQDLNARFGRFYEIDGAVYFGARNNYNGFHHLYKYND
jgi:hypothetical protein